MPKDEHFCYIFANRHILTIGPNDQSKISTDLFLKLLFSIRAER